MTIVRKITRRLLHNNNNIYCIGCTNQVKFQYNNINSNLLSYNKAIHTTSYHYMQQQYDTSDNNNSQTNNINNNTNNTTDDDDIILESMITNGNTQSQTNNDNEQQHSIDQIKQQILSTALNDFVSIYGFTIDSMIYAIQKHNYSTALLGLFNDNNSDATMSLISYYIKKNEYKLTELLLSTPLETMNMYERLLYSIKTRLELNKQYISHWHRACSICIQPLNISITLHLYNELIDELLHLCGDRSSDMSYYSKRASLLIIYCNTELYMLTDKSHNYNSTWRFLRQQLDTYNSINTIDIHSNIQLGYKFANAFVQDSIQQLCSKLATTSNIKQ